MRTSPVVPAAKPLLISLLGLMAACTTTSEPRDSNASGYGPWVKTLETALIAQGDAGSLVAAAMLKAMQAPDDPKGDQAAVELLRRAASLSPTDRSIATLHVSTCLSTPGCDALAPAAALQRIDPDNGIALFPALSAALAQDDAGAIDDVSKQMSNASAFDLYFNPTVVTIADALARTGLPPEPKGRRTQDPSLWVTTAASGAAGRGLPPLAPFAKTCRESDPTSDRRRYCLKITATLLSADTVLMQGIGASLTQRIAEPGSMPQTTAQAWRRTFTWRSQQMQKTISAFRWRRSAQASLEAARAHRREEDSIVAVLKTFGLRAEPPTGWTPPARPE